MKTTAILDQNALTTLKLTLNNEAPWRAKTTSRSPTMLSDVENTFSQLPSITLARSIVRSLFSQVLHKTMPVSYRKRQGRGQKRKFAGNQHGNNKKGRKQRPTTAVSDEESSVPTAAVCVSDTHTDVTESVCTGAGVVVPSTSKETPTTTPTSVSQKKLLSMYAEIEELYKGSDCDKGEGEELSENE